MSVKTSGPILDGTAPEVTAEFLEESVEALAERGRRLVQENTAVFRHPTGHYRSAIVTEARPGGYAITDGGLVYGPWLAGTTRRNASTGFPGYDHWEEAARELDSDMVRIVTPQLRNYRRKLGGRR
jgi:hypothetical protein